MAKTMKSAVFVELNGIVLEEKPIPDIGPLDALIRITATTTCGTDMHILKGEYPAAKGLTVGHEPVGIKFGLNPQGIYVSSERRLVIAYFSNDPNQTVQKYLRPLATSDLFGK